MKYMGGKHRQGKRIAELIKQVLEPGQIYAEPFCGSMAVACRVNHDKMLLADVSQALITMWNKMLEPGFELPDHVSEAEYQTIKTIRDPNDWRTAYYGYGLSFGGKYFGGYARDKKDGKRQYDVELKKSIVAKTAGLKTAIVVCSEYDKLEIPPNSVVYCDPPYMDRTRPHDCQKFDYPKYWNWCREQVRNGHKLLVTEFIIPADFVVLHNFGDTVVRHHSSKGADGTCEVVACHESQINFWLEVSNETVC